MPNKDTGTVVYHQGAMRRVDKFGDMPADHKHPTKTAQSRATRKKLRAFKGGPVLDGPGRWKKGHGGYPNEPKAKPQTETDPE